MLLNRSIIFVHQKTQGDLISNSIKDLVSDWSTYYEGRDTSYLRDFSDGFINTLIACDRISEGIDISDLSTVILIASNRARLTTIQRIGRCLRSDPDNPDKVANVIDLVLDLDDNEALEVAIVENIQRDDLNVIEEGKGYKRLADEFGYDHEKISKFMSKSRSHISNTLRLLTLPEDIISLIEEGHLTAGQARPLIGLSNASQIAETILERKLSARSVEQLTRQHKGPQKSTQLVLDSNVINTQKKIEDALGLKVDIKNKKNNSGKITIEYKNLEQFDLISNKLKN